MKDHENLQRNYPSLTSMRQMVLEIGEGGGQLAKIWVAMCPAKTKSRTITRPNFFIEEPPKTYKYYMNLLIFLDLTYNPCKNFKFYSLQGKLSKFSYFTYNQGKIFLILPITGGGVTCIPGLHCELPPPSLEISHSKVRNLSKMDVAIL